MLSDRVQAQCLGVLFLLATIPGPAGADCASTGSSPTLVPTAYEQLADSAIQIAEGHSLAGRLDDAANLIASLLPLAGSDEEGHVAAARLTAQLGLIRKDQRDYDSAVRLLVQARELAEAIGDRRTTAIAVNGLGLVEYSKILLSGRTDFGAATGLFNTALALRRELGDDRGVAESLFDLGLAAQMSAQDGRARELFQQSYEISTRLCDRLLMSYALRHLAYLLEAEGKIDEAILLHERTLALREQVGFKRGIAGSLGALADLHTGKQELSRAKKYLERAVTLAEELHDDVLRAGLLESLGRAQRESGEWEKALSTLQQCHALAEAAGDAEIRILALTQIGTILAVTTRRAESFASFDNALHLATLTNDPRKLAPVLLAYASALYRSELCERGDELLQRMEKLAQEEEAVGEDIAGLRKIREETTCAGGAGS